MDSWNTVELTAINSRFENLKNSFSQHPLKQLGQFFNGLSGLNKNNFNTGNNYYVPYVNVFNNLEINTHIDHLGKVDIGIKHQNNLLVGDVIFTGSSESLMETGLSSVLTEPFHNLFLNSFCFGFRFDDPSLMHPGFSKYLFRSESVRKQIIQHVNGVTRYNLSKRGMNQVTIPLLPLWVQIKITKTLDRFSQLEAEIQQLLPQLIQYHEQQYQYYRDQLLKVSD